MVPHCPLAGLHGTASAGEQRPSRTERVRERERERERARERERRKEHSPQSISEGMLMHTSARLPAPLRGMMGNMCHYIRAPAESSLNGSQGRHRCGWILPITVMDEGESKLSLHPNVCQSTLPTEAAPCFTPTQTSTSPLFSSSSLSTHSPFDALCVCMFVCVCVYVCLCVCVCFYECLHPVVCLLVAPYPHYPIV